MTVVTWRASALADVARIARRVAEENPVAARRLARGLLIAGDSLAVFPRRGRPGLGAGTRELVGVRPYVLVYRHDERADVVRVLRVWHAAQDR